MAEESKNIEIEFARLLELHHLDEGRFDHITRILARLVYEHCEDVEHSIAWVKELDMPKYSTGQSECTRGWQFQEYCLTSELENFLNHPTER